MQLLVILIKPKADPHTTLMPIYFKNCTKLNIQTQIFGAVNHSRQPQKLDSLLLLNTKSDKLNKNCFYFANFIKCNLLQVNANNYPVTLNQIFTNISKTNNGRSMKLVSMDVIIN